MKLVLTLLASCSVSVLSADPVQFQPAAPLHYRSAPLTVGTYAFPCVTDWNGDGRKDLLVGFQIESKIALLLNSGTDSQPVFTNMTILQADGMDIIHPACNCGSPAPWVCDFDGDGKRDLLVGDGKDGEVWFYRNTNTDAAPRLVSMGRLKAGSANLTVGSRAAPFVYDWDADGLPDLLCGAGDGYVYLFRNTNNSQSPIYAPAEILTTGGTNLFMGIRSVVRCFDWDGDGLIDLVGSSDTGVYWCRNTNSNSAIMLQAPVAIRAPVAGIGLVPIVTAAVPGARMRVFPVDWNNDGVMDLILGNADGSMFYYEGYRFAFTRVASSPGRRAIYQWKSAPFVNYDILATASLNATPWKAMTNLPSGGITTVWTNALSENQQFLRIQIAE